MQADRQISKFGAELLLECLNCPGDLGNKPAIVLYVEGIIKFTKLRPGERNKGAISLQVMKEVLILQRATIVAFILKANTSHSTSYR